MLDPNEPMLWVDIDGTIFLNTTHYEIVLNADSTIDVRRKEDGYVVKIIRKGVGHFIHALLNKADDYMLSLFALLPGDQIATGSDNTENKPH